MAAAMMREDEELQHNLMTSEEDAEYEEDYELDQNLAGENENAFAANNQLLSGVNEGQLDSAIDEDQSEEDEDEDEEDGEDEEDEEEEEEEDNIEDDLSNEDAEGEEDEEFHQSHTAEAKHNMEDEEEEDDDDDDEDEEDEDGEGVGAVKIQPGLLEDDEDADVQEVDVESEESEDDASKESSDVESEAEAVWEGEADEEDSPSSNQCIFCHQDEDHDPSADFEEYLACAVCADHAHRQCARDAHALQSDEDAEDWRCPNCVTNFLEPETAMLDAGAPITARRSSAPKLARDLLPSQKGAIRPDSHSVFNHLIVDNDPMDGSRLLRKRKTSTADVDAIEAATTPNKRRRELALINTSHSALPAMSPTAETDEDPSEAEEVLKSAEVDQDKTETVEKRAQRTLRPKSQIQSRGASIIKSSRTSLIINFRVDSIELQDRLSRAPKPEKKKKSRQPLTIARALSSAPPPVYVPQSYSQPFYSFHDRENDELKSKPYGGILTEAQADTSRTLPQPEDRRMFDDARQKAEEEWKVKTAAVQAEAETVKKPRKVSGPASQIECINFGGYEIDTWYAAPYPEEYSRNRVLFICEFCLKYMNSEYVAWRHKMKCQAKHPPGDEIYRDGSIAVFEVDGRKNPVYCQNLCLLAKLFLGSKTLYYDVEPFLFYVMTEYDEFGCHFVGYFSKEKRPSSQNNVSCILTLPIHQRKGYGNLLIDFSYLLTRVEAKSGSPEKPLSDMGLVSYRNYWRLVLCYQLRRQTSKLSIIDISERTGMTADDIVSALEGLRALVRDPATGTYALRLDFDYFEEYIQKWENKNYVRLNPKALVWTPYVMGRNNQNIMEHGPPMTAIEQRLDDEDDGIEIGDHQEHMTNGVTDIIVNGTSNGHNSEHMSLQEDSVIVSATSDDLNLDHLQSNDNGQSAGSVAGSSTSPTRVSPSTTRVLRQTLATTPKLNGFAPTTSPTIPATYFVVYPPVPGSRPGARPRPSLGRLPKPVSTSSAPRSPVSRRKSGISSSRRSSSKRSGAARKSSGGTGRGPGRWPKGTKKSDFGNADSGPGLPPKLLKTRSRLGVEVTLGSEEGEDGEEEEDDDEYDEAARINGEEEVDEDAILYETPGPRRRNHRESSKRSKVRLKDEDEDEMDDMDLVTGDIDTED